VFFIFNNFNKFLDTVHIKDLIHPERAVIQTNKETTLPELLKVLIDNQILSVPVWDSEDKNYVGFVDVVDILSIIITFTEFKEFATLFSNQKVSWEDWISQENDVFANGTAYDASGDFTRRNPWKETKESSELASLFELMGDRKVHRVAVFNDDHSKLTAILSQSKIIEFLADQILKNYHEIAAIKVSEFFKNENIISINDGESVVDAFKKMLENGISGLPVVDSNNGRIKYALSVSDIKASLSTTIFTDILLPLPEFVSKITSFYKRDDKPISCNKDDTLGSILQVLLITKYHRVFVVDDNEVPVGVITLSDILAFFASTRN